MRVARVLGAVLQDAGARFEGQVEPLEVGISLLQPVHDAQALAVVLEASVLREETVQGPLA